MTGPSGCRGIPSSVACNARDAARPARREPTRALVQTHERVLISHTGNTPGTGDASDSAARCKWRVR